MRQHVHGTLGIRAVTVEVVRAQIAQRQGVPIGQRVVVDDAVILRPDAARVVIPGNAPRHGFLKARLRVPLIVDDRAILRHCPQHIHIRLQALHALPRRAQCIHIARMIARIHRTGDMGRTRLIDVRPAEPVDIVDQRHGDIAPLRHLPVPLRAAFRDITRKGIAHRHTHRLPVRVQADGIGVCVAVRRIAHLRQPQRVQYAADRRVVAHILRPQGEQRAVNVKTQVYPGFPTDLQQPMTALLCMAHGTSTVCETIFEQRFKHLDELRRMGAHIKLVDRTVLIEGVRELYGAPVTVTDLRAGAALVVAGLMAKGVTEIYETSYIDRGYERIEEKLRALGAEIRREKI